MEADECVNNVDGRVRGEDDVERSAENKRNLEDDTRRLSLNENIPTSRGGVGDDCCCCRRPDARAHSTIKFRSFQVNPFNAINALSASKNDLYVINA